MPTGCGGDFLALAPRLRVPIIEDDTYRELTSARRRRRRSIRSIRSRW